MLDDSGNTHHQTIKDTKLRLRPFLRRSARHRAVRKPYPRMAAASPPRIHRRIDVHDHRGATLHPAHTGADRTGTAGLLHPGQPNGSASGQLLHPGRTIKPVHILGNAHSRLPIGIHGIMGNRGNGIRVSQPRNRKPRHRRMVRRHTRSAADLRNRSGMRRLHIHDPPPIQSNNCSNYWSTRTKTRHQPHGTTPRMERTHNQRHKPHEMARRTTIQMNDSPKPTYTTTNTHQNKHRLSTDTAKLNTMPKPSAATPPSTSSSEETPTSTRKRCETYAIPHNKTTPTRKP